MSQNSSSWNPFHYYCVIAVLSPESWRVLIKIPESARSESKTRPRPSKSDLETKTNLEYDSTGYHAMMGDKIIPVNILWFSARPVNPFTQSATVNAKATVFSVRAKAARQRGALRCSYTYEPLCPSAGSRQIARQDPPPTIRVWMTK